MAVRDNVKKKKIERENTTDPNELAEGSNVGHGNKKGARNKTKQPKQTRGARAGVKDSARVEAENAPRKEHFKWAKMWINYLLSMTMKDRGKIPDNIGDRILITNNVYITKLYMTTIVHIVELGPECPETLLQCLNDLLRDRGNRAILDLTFKNSKYDYDPKNSGLMSRIKQWENIVDASPGFYSNRVKERAARCLYTVEVAQSGKILKNSRTYLSIRAKDINTLNMAEKIIYDGLASMGCTYLPAYGNIKQKLEYISLIGNHGNDLKGVAPVMTFNQVLSQIIPNCGSFNDRAGYYVGINILNGAPFFIDFGTITSARNIYVVAPSGVGKTVLAMNMAQSAYENGSACCFMDIKGNEYTNFINATNGYIVSLRPTSIEYINSWVMHKEDTTEEMAEAYFKSRLAFSKQQMIIISGLRDRESLIEFEELIDEFHDSLYISLGVVPYNMNSWDATEQLNPYTVFDHFEAYLTPQKRQQYNLNKSLMGTIRMYMSATGSKAYIFKREFDYSKILESDTISFDFGMLSGGGKSDVDEDLFRLKFLYMNKLNGDFVTRKYAEGRRTFCILEESQVVTDSIMEMYIQAWTLRRSQNQDTVLLGNSVQALQHNKFATPIIENTRALFVGDLTLDARKVVMEQFGLQHLENYIKMPGSSSRFKNCFLLVNKMQDKSLTPIIKVVMDPDKWNGKDKKYKVLTPVKEKNVMGGN